MVPRVGPSSKMMDLSLASDVSEPAFEGDEAVFSIPFPPSLASPSLPL